ncbi:MAG: 16S rRNA (cytidine(1402)-2'-O)-methyltransferase [Burkholderiaceae bacterium]
MATPNASLMLQAAAGAAGGQDYPKSTLYVVATPIGNLADITLRAIHVLTIVDAIACEDTRHTAGLLQSLGLSKPLLALHQHNEREGAAAVIARLANGERIAYVSDAGTPAVSDPGALLVAATRDAGWRCIPIPGASSVAAALSVAGDAQGEGFVFLGFAPARGEARSRWLEKMATCEATQVLLEAPHRIEQLAGALAAACGPRRVTLARELTKQFESVVTLPAADLPDWLAGDPNRLRGEFVVVVHAVPATAGAADTRADDALLQTLLAEFPLKQAVALAARLSATSRNALYERALALKGATRDR